MYYKLQLDKVVHVLGKQYEKRNVRCLRFVKNLQL